MTRFAVRVELHHRHEPSYTILHQKMAAAGYVRTIKAGDGQVYDLPTGLYVRHLGAGVTAVQVCDHVRPIAQSVDANAWVIAFRYDEAAWNLSAPVAKAA